MNVKGKRINFGLDRFSGVYLWVIFIMVFGIWTPHIFLSLAVLHSVVSTQAVSGMVAIAALIPLTSGNFDLSIGANANLSGIIAVLVLVNWHWSVPAAVLLGFGVGLLIGVINGFIVVRLGVSSFITTLAMGSILIAVQTIVTGGLQPFPPSGTAFGNLTQIAVGGFQLIFLYLIVLGVIAWWFLGHTPAGRYLYAIGGNSEAARLSGIRVGRWSWLSLIISGGISGLAGVLYCSQSGPVLQFGPNLLLPAFAAVFLGSTQLRPGQFNVWGSLLAIYVLATGVEGLQLVSGQEWLADMFNGVALILAVSLAVSRQQRVIGTGRKKRRMQIGGPADVSEVDLANLAPPDDVSSRQTGDSNPELIE